MANTKTIRYNLRPYKNVIPCGGYKLIGGGQIGDSVIPGYVGALLSGSTAMLNPTLFGVIDEQVEVIKEESFILVKNIKMFLAPALYRFELEETSAAEFEKISKKGKVLNCYDIINTWYHMLGCEAFEISNEEQIDLLCLHDFLSKMRATILDPTRQIIQTSSIFCEPDNSSTATSDFIYFTEHGNELYLRAE